VKSVQQMLGHALRGCPKRNVCSLRQAKSKTCLNGPYTYCGKYRSIVEIKKQNINSHYEHRYE